MKKFNFSKLKKPLLIAEIGNNHEGSFKRAKKLIDIAKQGGADAVKFQTIDPEKFYHHNEKKQLKKYLRFKLSNQQYKKLALYSKQKNLLFISTPFDLNSARFLKDIVDIIKISSGDNNFLPLIDICIKFKKPIIISTGLLIEKEIYKLYNYLKDKIDLKKLCFLHCVASYPVEPKNANLSFIKRLKKKLSKITIGYSDHTVGPYASILASLNGSSVIEKHFTDDKNFSNFRDHLLSADKEELKLISYFIKNQKIYLGKGTKIKLEKAEKKNYSNLRRSIYAIRNIKKNETFNENNISILRPFKKNNIKNYKIIINKKSKKNYTSGELVN
jgi:sialic acid synthase SpsE